MYAGGDLDVKGATVQNNCGAKYTSVIQGEDAKLSVDQIRESLDAMQKQLDKKSNTLNVWTIGGLSVIVLIVLIIIFKKK